MSLFQPAITSLFQFAITNLQIGSLFFCGSLAVIIGTAHKQISAAIERRTIRTALGKLDDFMLKDMGIARSDIERIAPRTYPSR